MACREARHFVEQDCWITHLPLIEIEDPTDLFGRLGTRNCLQRPFRLHCLHPVSEILVPIAS